MIIILFSLSSQSDSNAKDALNQSLINSDSTSAQCIKDQWFHSEGQGAQL